MQPNQPLGFRRVHTFLTSLFEGDLHAKRVLSLANATLGVIRTASLAVHAVGLGLAQARGLKTKHAIKQVDRLLSNEGIDIDAALRHWAPYVVGPRTSINVAMDWTEFDADGQATIMLSLLTRHGRATPLMWLTVDTATLKNHRNEYEYQALVRLAAALPADIMVCIVADRGFGDHKLYRVLTEELKFDHVIRFRGNITVTAQDGETRTASAWVGPGGRAKVLRGAQVTAERHEVGTVLCVRDKDMKQAWCLATSRAKATANDLKRLYGKRWGIECGFRDTKDPALRHGNGGDPRQHAGPARSPMAAERIGGRADDIARRRRRGARLRSPSQVKHHPAPHPLAVPTGLHALRPHPEYARTATGPTCRALRRDARRAASLRRYFRSGVKMRGAVRYNPSTLISAESPRRAVQPSRSRRQHADADM